MRILVTGLLPYDSGKTTITLMLAEELRNRGLRIGYFKPVGGHNGWYQYETVMHSLELGVLVGHDAYIVADRLDMLDLIDMISPLDILTMPLDPFSPGFRSSTYISRMNNPIGSAAIARITSVWTSNDLDRLERSSTYIFCKDTYERLNKYLRKTIDDLIDVFRSKKNTVVVEANTDYLEKILSSPKLYESIDSALKIVSSMYDLVFVESYNDSAAPTPGSLDSRLAIVVAPSKVAVYDGERYRKSVLLTTYTSSPMFLTTSKIIDILGTPMALYDLPPGPGEESEKIIGEIAEFILRMAV